MTGNTLNEIVNNNYRKIHELRESGIEPYPRRFKVSHNISVARELSEDAFAIIAGRVVLMRLMGKAAFAHIKDGSGKMQIYVKKDNIGEENYDLFKKSVHVGDFLGIEGKLFVTHTGEKTLKVSKLTILSKSIRPLPEKWHGLSDAETRYRERHLDLISNEDIKKIFMGRSAIISAIRSVLDCADYVEVETPVLCGQAGGAAARPFITFHNVYKTELYLRIATELHLKKLVIGGFDGVYEIGRVFRNEGIDANHNPEFTTLEAYRAYSDYNGMAELLEMVFSKCCDVMKIDSIDYNGAKINLKPPFQRIFLPEVWKRKCGQDIHEILNGKTFNKTNLRKLADSLHIEYTPTTPSAKIFERVFDLKIIPEIKQPAFIMDYPTAVTPLAKCKIGDEALVERFEFYAAGLELANAYTELNDPEDQKERLLEQMRQRDEERNQETDILDKDFIEAMEYGMPPTGGIGIGIDRLIMLFTGKPTIREVVLFPLLKGNKNTDGGPVIDNTLL
ncbi:MAG: lysine--tRNA ligase [Elusimicrobia bacterium]|nr:lysine--tRNA ligase [Elusimicrobiota bacterium]